VPSKRYSVEQIVAKLREAEKLQGQGLTIPQSCKRLGISDQTLLPVAPEVRGPEGG
jgi:hypothetical protein